MLVVKFDFEDKFTGEIIKAGTIVEIEDGTRKEELLQRQLIAEAEVLKLTNENETEIETEELELTVKEIKALLTEKGIAFDDRARKDDLLKLLEGAE